MLVSLSISHRRLGGTGFISMHMVRITPDDTWIMLGIFLWRGLSRASNNTNHPSGRRSLFMYASNWDGPLTFLIRIFSSIRWRVEENRTPISTKPMPDDISRRTIPDPAVAIVPSRNRATKACPIRSGLATSFLLVRDLQNSFTARASTADLNCDKRWGIDLLARDWIIFLSSTTPPGKLRSGFSVFFWNFDPAMSKSSSQNQFAQSTSYYNRRQSWFFWMKTIAPNRFSSILT